MSKHARRKSPKPERPGSRLDLPTWITVKRPDSLRSRESKHGYRHAIDEFIPWYCSDRLSFNKIVVTRHWISSKIATSQRERSTGDLAPLHRLAYEAADGGLLSPELFASTRRVKGVKKLGVRLGNWLTAEEAALLAVNRTR